MTRAAVLTIIAVCAFAAGILGFLTARPHLSTPRAMHRAVHPPTSASYPEGAIGQCMRMADLRRWKAAEDDCDFAYTQIQVGGIVSALSLSISPTDAENVAAATAIALGLRGEARTNLGETRAGVQDIKEALRDFQRVLYNPDTDDDIRNLARTMQAALRQDLHKLWVSGVAID